MGFWSMVLAFLPWVAFKFILLVPGFDELLTLKFAILVAASICAYRILKGLDKGIIAWGSGAFFLVTVIMVVGFTNIWYMKHLGVFSNGTLAVLTWASVLAGNPFTLAYAKQTVAPEYWDLPRFIHKNYRITAAWGFSFSVGLIDAFIRQQSPDMPGYIFEIIDNSSMLAAILFTTRLSKKPQQQVAQ